MGLIHHSSPLDLIREASRRHGLEYFIETGTHLGATADWAAGLFKKVVTIEADAGFRQQAIDRCHRHGNIDFVLGETTRELARVMPAIDGPAAILLDAHWCGGYGQEKECPILEEIATINASPHDHWIFIDDARLFLAPPPPPHQPDHWPAAGDLLQPLLRGEGGRRRYTAVIEDTVIAIPWEHRAEIAAYAGRPGFRAPWAKPRTALGRALRKLGLA